MKSHQETIFSDLSTTFTAHPVTGNVGLVKNENAIKQSIKNIVLTNFYERPYNPTYGANLISQLFENMNSITKFVLIKNIRVTLDNHEPRADIIDIRVDVDYDKNTINVTIVFKPINSLESQTVNVILERIR
jgi:phage baseplate assembly protein W